MPAAASRGSAWRRSQGGESDAQGLCTEEQVSLDTHYAPKLSGQRMAGTVLLSANCLSKDILVPHSLAQETAYCYTMCLLAQQKPNQVLVPTSCAAQWWIRGHHQGSQPQAFLMTMPGTFSNPLTLVSGPGMERIHG